MRKWANISPYMRSQLVIYDFATAPFWISLNTRKILFYFLSVWWPTPLSAPCKKSTVATWCELPKSPPACSVSAPPCTSGPRTSFASPRTGRRRRRRGETRRGRPWWSGGEATSGPLPQRLKARGSAQIGVLLSLAGWKGRKGHDLCCDGSLERRAALVAHFSELLSTTALGLNTICTQ